MLDRVYDLLPFRICHAKDVGGKKNVAKRGKNSNDKHENIRTKNEICQKNCQQKMKIKG